MRKKHTPGCPCCNGGSGPPPIGEIYSCICPAIPGTLKMISGAYCQQVFPSCTLQWGPTPPELAELPLGPNCFLSVETYYHDLFQSHYRWYFGCIYQIFYVKRAFLPTTQGGPFLDASFYAWGIGLGINTCNAGAVPFELTVGRIFPGGDIRCQLVITEA